jgi:hypothetical protein
MPTYVEYTRYNLNNFFLPSSKVHMPCGHFGLLICRQLGLKVFPFPLSNEELMCFRPVMYVKRAANLFSRFAYSFVSFMLRQYCDSCSAYRRSAANKKNAKSLSTRLYVQGAMQRQ